MGPVKYIAFYIAGGIAAFALQVAVSPNSTAPTLGASGAIAAVLGGYILIYPRARVLTLVIIIFFFTVIEIPAWVMLGIWFAEQAAFGAAGFTHPTGASGGVAYFAHIGGFIFGLLVIRLLATKRKRPAPKYPVY
jgi:membrane associated rhomboid family serine protease